MIRNEHVQYTKPYALGSFDMRVKNEWVVMRDATQLEYFYNPLTMYMQWKQPAGTVLCKTCTKKLDPSVMLHPNLCWPDPGGGVYRWLSDDSDTVQGV
mgnify:CR=1 FL=1